MCKVLLHFSKMQMTNVLTKHIRIFLHIPLPPRFDVEGHMNIKSLFLSAKCSFECLQVASTKPLKA